MSRDPIRLADQSDPPSPEADLMRGLIRAQQNVRPTAAKMDELAGRLGPILEPKSPSPAPGATWLSASVAVAAVAALAVVTVAVQTTGPTKAAEAVVSTSAPAEQEEVLLPPELQAEPEPAAEPDAPRAVSVDALPTAVVNVNVRKVPAVAAPRCDEVMLVDDADTALRSGNPERALAVVREIEQRCTAGVLVQERERIAIEALTKAGRVEQARARARAFEARFPTSPHLRRVRQVAE